ncbi:MAG: hypothetical protein EBZ48_11575 [Proteobacteria bacterium]|nr:hypothetical protein [Pseudomonadota bacterium]
MTGLLQKLNKRPRRGSRENAGSRVALPERTATARDSTSSGTSTSGDLLQPVQQTDTSSGTYSSISQELERTGSDALPRWVQTPPTFNRWVDSVVPAAIELLRQDPNDLKLHADEIRTHARKAVLTAASSFSAEHALTPNETDAATAAVIHLLTGTGPLEPLFSDPLVTDIFVTGHNSVRCMRRGQLLETPFRFRTAKEYRDLLDNFLRQAGRELSTDQPLAHGILTEFQRARMQVIHPALTASPEPYLALRVPRLPHATLYELIRTKVLPATLAAWLTEIMALPRCALMIAGAGGTGKTTLATALLGSTPSNKRIITIEEAPEIFPASHQVEKLLLGHGGRTTAVIQQVISIALEPAPDWIAFGASPSGCGYALLRVLEGEASSLVTITAPSETGALRLILDDLRQSLPSAPSDELTGRLYSGIDMVLCMSSSGGRPFVEALKERSPNDPGKFTETVRFAGELDGKRSWYLVNPDSTWMRIMRERGHELRLGAGLLPAP